MSNKVVFVDFQGYQVSFNDNGWINATGIAKKFGKETYDWLRQRETLDYLFALHEALQIKTVSRTEFNTINELEFGTALYKNKVFRLSKKTGLVKTKSGSPENGGGTWLHPKLAVYFARWLSVEFAVWCDMQIDQLIRDGKQFQEKRKESKLGYTMVTDALKLKAEGDGKELKPYHYINEARLINGLITSVFKGRDRDQLSGEELDLVTFIESKDAIYIASGLDYQQRKNKLTSELTTLTAKALSE